MANKAVVGEKVGMTQVWDDDNRVVPVTVVRVEPMRVVQIKTNESDGYNALQVTFGDRDARKLNSPDRGHYDTAGVRPGKRLLELRLDDVSDYEVGQEITVDTLVAGELIDVTAISKGKGFAGVMKRYNFAGQRASHGGPGVQGHPHGRAHGRREGDHAEPEGRLGRRREEPPAGAGRRPRAEGRPRGHP